MGFRFRRSIKILPGIRLNFGKRGVSTSIGVRGAHVTFGKTGTRTTVGLAIRVARLPYSGFRLLCSAQHLTNSRDTNGAQRARHSGFPVFLLPVFWPISRRLLRRLVCRPIFCATCLHGFCDWSPHASGSFFPAGIPARFGSGQGVKRQATRGNELGRQVANGGFAEFISLRRSRHQHDRSHSSPVSTDRTQRLDVAKQNRQNTQHQRVN